MFINSLSFLVRYSLFDIRYSNLLNREQNVQECDATEAQPELPAPVTKKIISPVRPVC